MGWLLILLAAAPTKVAVLDVATSNVDPALVRTLSEVLTAEVQQSGAFADVISGRDVVEMLQFEQEKQMLGCEDDKCFAEIGGALGVDKLVISHVGRVDETYVVNLKLVDIREVKTERRAYRTVKGKPDLLLGMIREAVAELVGANKVTPSPAVQAEIAPTEEPAVGVLPVVLWAAGGVALGTGIAFGLKAEGHERAAADPSFVGAQREITAGETSALIANIALVSGVALITSGFVAWLVDALSEP